MATEHHPVDDLRAALETFSKPAGKANTSLGCLLFVLIGAGIFSWNGLGRLGPGITVLGGILAIVILILLNKVIFGPINRKVTSSVADIERRHGLSHDGSFDLLLSDPTIRQVEGFRDFVRVVWGEQFVARLRTVEGEELAKATKEYEKKSLPSELQVGDINAFARTITGDLSISQSAVAFWPNEDSAEERLAVGIAVRLATGGLVGAPSRTHPFGLLSVSPLSIWRIEIGDILSSVSLHHVENIKKTGTLQWNRVDVSIQQAEDSSALKLVLTVPTSHSTVAKSIGPEITLSFPHDFNGKLGEHAFFAQLASNRTAAESLARELGSWGRTAESVGDR